MSGPIDPYSDLFRLLELPRDPERLRELRRKIVWAYSWAVPSPEAVSLIVSHSPLIEIGAGTGYWAWLLRQAGADIEAFDRAVQSPPHWTRVLEGGPERVAQHPGRTLFLCWPPMGESLAADCVERHSGRYLVSIGEKGPRARTGDERFRSLLADRFVERRELALPRWPGYEDSLSVYERV